MRLTTEIRLEKDYLYIRILGQFDLADAKAILEDSLRSADKFNLTRILIDYREIGGRIPDIDRYEYGMHHAQLIQERIARGLPVVRAAYVGSYPLFDSSH